MRHVIVGNNATGKTVVTLSIVEKHINENIITNVEPYISTMWNTREHDVSKVSAIEDVFECEFSEITSSTRFSKKLKDLLNLLSMEGDIIILDEPEVGMYELECDKLSELLVNLSTIGYIIWVNSHIESLMGDADSMVKYYKPVLQDGEFAIREITAEESMYDFLTI